ncbi:hypothetical protein [Coprothermobacter platensis]|uniref:hypothetical protein n=1 Tax=Coprothermobacter platensis TaxID=108819 RepID=UPI000379CA19|nr:hypothetical protein [Coprothermobacter platensis]
MITFSVFGRKNSGKTTVCQELINILQLYGTVAYEKHAHSSIKLEKHLQMASKTVWSLIRGPEGSQLIATKEQIDLPSTDFLVIEGYMDNAPNILCVKHPYDLEAITEHTLAAVSLNAIPGTKTMDELPLIVERHLNNLSN